MAVDLMHVGEVIKAALIRRLGNEIDLIFLHGSQFHGTPHRYSDLDISYVPVHESTWASITVMVDDILFDLYPIHWSKLEQMASFQDVSSSVLLHHEIVYRRTEQAGERMRGLTARLQALLQPDARTDMVRKAQASFQETGYEVYLLRQQAVAGHLPSCLLHAQRILRTVLHCLAVCNQRCIDTRKLAQVLALPHLPAGLAETVDRITRSYEPGELLSACETLLSTTRDLLLAEQRQVPRSQASYPDVFRAAYPELKGDLQRVLLACERQDPSAIPDKLMSLYHELMLHLTWASTGIEHSGFNSLAEYEQDLEALGFPALLPHAAAGDFAELHRQCLAFDQRLRMFLGERAVDLNSFATVEELQAYLSSTADH